MRAILLAMSIKAPDPHFKVLDFEEVDVDYAPYFEVGGSRDEFQNLMCYCSELRRII